MISPDDRLTREEIEYFKKIIIEYESIHSVSSYSYVKNFLSLFDIPFPIIKIRKGERLYRSRPHLNNEKFFYQIRNISYRPDWYNIKDFGRANEPVQPIFYCANDRETAFSETSKLTRENSDAPFDTLTTGEWEVQEDLTVCAIISNEEIHKLNEGMNSIKNDFQKMIERINSQEGVTEWWSVFELLAKQFMVSAKGDTSKYKISCAFASYAYEQTGKEWTPSSKNITESSLKSIDGILYASIINAEKGINLALKPSVVDDKKIKLLNAMRATMKKLNEANYIEDDIVICSSIDADNGLIHWE